MNKSELESKIDELQQWFEENPKLPPQVDRLLLKRFYKCVKYDMEETKKLIEYNYSLRNKGRNVFLERDPEEDLVKKALLATDLVFLPGLTPQRHKLLFYRIADPDASKFHSVSDTKVFSMMSDCRFTMPDNDIEDNANDDQNDEEGNNDEDDAEDDVLPEIADGDVQIIDMANHSMGHMYRVSFSTMRLYMKYLQEAYPMQLRAMHAINCPPFLDTLISIMRPFINNEVFKLAHFHTQGIESLYEHVPRDMLPEEYGGKAGKLADLKANWVETMKEKREFLMDPNQWKVEPPKSQGRWWWS